MRRSLPLFLGLLVCTAPVLADDPPEQVAVKAAVILERNCLQCHRGAGSASKLNFNVLQPQTMIDADVIRLKTEEIGGRKVRRGDPDNSQLWVRVHRGTMPPRSQPQLSHPTPEDGKILADWIRGIDPEKPDFPKIPPRARVSLKTSMEAILADLKKLPDARTRGRQRYFSLVEMYNNPRISIESIKLARAALSKTINSLSWEPEIVIPRAIDPDGKLGTFNTVFAIDLEQVGWKRDHWRALRSKYPYAIGFNNLDDPTLRDLEGEIQDKLKNDEPLYKIRADWFIATALQPALYHAMLYDLTLPDLVKRLPDANQPANPKQMTAGDLERFLGIDVIADIQRGEDRAMRGGFTASGVSGQNRLIERHRINKYRGAYWKSYDFKAANRRAILSQFPLGPLFPGHPFPQLAFEQDGGEIIFNLPNGLQAYLLIDSKDHRIDAGPTEVVSDALKTSGTPAIVNGLSCMSCHKEGMIDPPADEIREYTRLFGAARDQMLRLYPTKEALQTKVDADADLFQKKLEEAVGRFLDLDADHRVKDFPEPVSELARNYLLEELDLEAVAAELYEPDSKRLRTKLENDELLQRLGLAVLLRPDGKIKRAFWEGAQGGTSIMQLVAFQLDYTTPEFR
jgi:serine/threonine-protein kinase